MQAADYANVLGFSGLAALINADRTRNANRCFTSAGFVIGSSAPTKIKQANTVTYTNNGSTATTVSATPGIGQFYSQTAQEIPFTPTTHDIAPNASTVQERCYLVLLNNAGSAIIVAGAIASGVGNAVWPDLPLANGVPGQHYGTPIGGCRIAVAAGTVPFTAGTGNLDGSNNAGVSTTYYNFSQYTSIIGLAQ